MEQPNHEGASVESDEWVARLKDPERRDDALTELRPLLLRGLRRAFASSGDSFAEDVTQEALLRILDKLDQFEGRSRFTTWAMSIAVRLGTSQVRRKHFKDVSLEALTGGEGLAVEVADSSSPAVSDGLERESFQATFGGLIDQLSDRQQVAIRALLEGMPVEEIAARTDSNRNAVYKLVHDARAKLKSGFEAAGYSASDLATTFARG